MPTQMSGKNVVITGATSGIGLATAMQLAQKGAQIIGVGRDQTRCEQARQKIIAQCPTAKVVYRVADLSSQKQLRELAENIRSLITVNGKGALDVLINNAGTVASWYTTTAEGFELQFAVNHLAPFLLTHELLPLLQSASSGRIITVSSGSHYRTKINWNDIQLRKHYHCLRAYKQCKLANVMFTCELNRKLGAASSVRAYAVDPGLVNTEIGFKGTSGIVRWVWALRAKNGLSPAAGAATSVYLASEAVLQNRNAVYWANCQPHQPSRYARRPSETEKLWQISAKMCGIQSYL